MSVRCCNGCSNSVGGLELVTPLIELVESDGAQPEPLILIWLCGCPDSGCGRACMCVTGSSV